MKTARIFPSLLFLLLVCTPSTYGACASTGVEKKNAIFREALTQSGNGEIPTEQRILTLVMFIGVLVALAVLASTFFLLMLRGFKRDREPPTVPREDVNERYKKCVRCGRKILWFRTFCPYCYGYQGKIKTGEKR